MPICLRSTCHPPTAVHEVHIALHAKCREPTLAAPKYRNINRRCGPSWSGVFGQGCWPSASMPRLIDALVISDCTVCICTDDEGGHPANGAAFRRDFVTTRGLCIRTLSPSIDFRRGHCVQSGKGRDRTEPSRRISRSSVHLHTQGIRPSSIASERSRSFHSTKRQCRIFKGGDVHQGQPMPVHGHAGLR